MNRATSLASYALTKSSNDPPAEPEVLYDVQKTPNRTLPFPDNTSKQQRINSFTQLDYILSATAVRLKFAASKELPRNREVRGRTGFFDLNFSRRNSSPKLSLRTLGS